MKLSILTATYNRGRFLPRLYESIVNNLINEMDIEWLIMDDGSDDNTEEVVSNFQPSEHLKIKFYKQKNQGKMKAINNLMEYVTGELCVECDSDDFFVEKSFYYIKKEYEANNIEKDIYALCFLKYDTFGKNMGNDFQNYTTTMFDLYFKEGEDGEKSLVYITEIRKKYKYELEENERFVTEARLHHKMDLKYKILCFNEPIMVCEYQRDGYSKNINLNFLENPYGYYKYFIEILEEMDTKKIKISKRLYIIKQFILFSYLTNKRFVRVKTSLLNIILISILWLPGIIKSIWFKRKNVEKMKT